MTSPFTFLCATCCFSAVTLGAPGGSAAEGPSYDLVDAFPGLTFEQPLGIVTAPGDASRVFVVEKTGRVKVVSDVAGEKPASSVFLDLRQPRDGALATDVECGVLGLAFPPDWAESRRCFVYYSLRIDGQLHQRLSRFGLEGGGGGVVDPRSEQPLFSQKDPASNHNGGDLAFGPDGYLYVTAGDGGAANDKFDNAGHIDKGFHAAILRLDVDRRPGSLPPNPHPGVARRPDGAAFYAVPADNPFVGAETHRGRKVDPAAVRTEIWATGLRNPWRISFDAETGRLFTGDVGQNRFEEVDIVTAGGDYGWPHREGLHAFTDGPTGRREPPAFRPVDPIFEYPRTVGISVTGGVVWRSSSLPSLRGAYVCADYGTGVVMALRDAGEPQWTAETLAREPGIAGLGIHPRSGEALFAVLGAGKVRKLARRAE